MLSITCNSRSLTSDRTASFISGLKIRIELFSSGNDQYGPTGNAKGPMHNWHSHDMQGLEVRLSVLREIPTFFSLHTPSDRLQRPIDVAEIIRTLQQTTWDMEAQFREQVRMQSSDYARLIDQGWTHRGPAYLLRAQVKSHIESSMPILAQTTLQHGRMVSSRSGMVASMRLYCAAVLGILKVREQPFSEFVELSLRIVLRDIQDTEALVCGANMHIQDLWTWKLLVALTAASVFKSPGIQALQTSIEKCAKRWAEGSGLVEWVDVKLSLHRVIWPKSSMTDTDVDSLWREALAR